MLTVCEKSRKEDYTLSIGLKYKSINTKSSEISLKIKYVKYFFILVVKLCEIMTCKNIDKKVFRRIKLLLKNFKQIKLNKVPILPKKITFE